VGGKLLKQKLLFHKRLWQKKTAMATDLDINRDARDRIANYRNYKIDIANATYGDSATSVLNPASFFHIFNIAATTAIVQLPTLGNGVSYYFKGYIINNATATMQFKPAATETINVGAASAIYQVPLNASKNRFVDIVGDSVTRHWYIALTIET